MFVSRQIDFTSFLCHSKKCLTITEALTGEATTAEEAAGEDTEATTAMADGTATAETVMAVEVVLADTEKQSNFK